MGLTARCKSITPYAFTPNWIPSIALNFTEPAQDLTQNTSPSKSKNRRGGASKHRSQPAAPEVDGAAARRVAALLLTRTLDDGRGFDGLTDPTLGLESYRNLAENDRVLARAIARTALSRKGQIDLAIKRMVDRPPPQKARHLIHTLSVAAAQILFMDVPDSAAVNIAVNLIDREARSQRFKGLANAVLRRMAREKDELLPKLKSDKLNTPKWMYERWKSGYDHVVARAIATHHGHFHANPVPIDLMPRIDAEVLHDALTKANIEVWNLDNGTMRLPKPMDVRKLPGFVEGHFWVQDAASTLPAKLVGATNGMVVADLCAAPGGKTSQLAIAGAHVHALDQSNNRLERLKSNLQRIDLMENVTPICADLTLWEPGKTFDAVLLDAPCSSTGTIRRHPDILWTKSQSDISELADLQLRLFKKAVEFVRPGGTIVFSNCSLDPLEGEILFKTICDTVDGIAPKPINKSEVAGYSHAVTDQGTLRSLPHKGPTGWEGQENGSDLGGDGFFAARFERTA